MLARPDQTFHVAERPGLPGAEITAGSGHHPDLEPASRQLRDLGFNEPVEVVDDG